MDIKQIKQVSVLTPKGAIKLYPPVRTIVDEAIENIDLIPDTAGQDGKVLTVDGIDLVWSTGGASQTLQETLDLGNTSTENLIFEEINAPLDDVGDAIAKNWITIKPLIQDGHDGENFYMGTSSTKNVAGYNDVFMMGWNLTAGGGPSTSGKPGIGYSMEQRYRPGGEDLTESHEFWIKEDGTQIRLKSYTISNDTNNIGLYHVVNALDLRAGNQSNSPYFFITGDRSAENSEMRMDNASGGFRTTVTTTGGIGDVTFLQTSPSSANVYRFHGAREIFFPGQFIYLNRVGGSEISWNSVSRLMGGQADNTFRMQTQDATKIQLRPYQSPGVEAWGVLAAGIGVNICWEGNTSSTFAVKHAASQPSGILAKFEDPTEALHNLYILADGRIGMGVVTPHSSAKLDITSTTQGFLPPRMTTTQRDAVGSPAEGLIIFNTTDTKLQVRAGGAWVNLH